MGSIENGTSSATRSSALWGTGSRGGDSRSSALWGTGSRGGEHRSHAIGRVAGLLAAAVAALSLPLSAAADDARGRSYVAPGVLQAAAKNDKVSVIVQAAPGSVLPTRSLALLGSSRRDFGRLGMVSMEVPSALLERLAELPGLIVTLDAAVRPAGFSSTQLWPYQNGLAKLWPADAASGPKPPAIAVVDSGIDTANLSFGARVVARRVFGPSSNGELDGRGHGTFVAGIAAGSAPGYAGASPTSDLVDLDVMDETGMARTSDVIAACEWILANKGSYDIRVANLSLHAASIVSVRYHPLNRAVQKLWFSGVTVVAAVGNYGVAGGPSGVVHAPGNDPFVISVGALDLGERAGLGDDGVAYWSAYGYTLEGFAKPEVVAAGRYMVGPVPPGSTLVTERPDKVVAPGYMQLSGTSFAAPVVAGAAAQILARHPDWTPDRVKGALMATARRVPEASLLQQGRGQVNALRAAAAVQAPDPNAGLNRFVVPDPAGGGIPVFDAAAWAEAAWNEAAWNEAAWSEAAWAENGGADAAWAEAAWSEAAWNEAAWSEAAWSEAAWSESTYEDAAEGDGTSVESILTAEDLAELEADPDLRLPGDPLP
ncbi:MAG TPA: S8 family serine peptidase [Gaiellaceae bacterium]|nr:S8 family serine peptidase [Gaiellaceae bacterium]